MRGIAKRKKAALDKHYRLPSQASPLAYAAEIARRTAAKIERRKDASRYINPGIPTDFAKFAPMVQIQTSGTVKPFEPYDFQIDLIRAIEANRNTVICKSRQMGISETICCYLLMRALTEPGFSAVIFSKTQEDSSQLGQRIRDMAVSLGPLCPRLTSDSKTKVFFQGLGKLYFLPVTARAARGIPSVSVVLFDEAAFIDGIEGVYQAAVPTLSMLGDRGKVIFNSTPNGRQGLFYRLLTGGAKETRKVLDSCRDLGGKAQNNIVPIERDRLKRHTRFWTYNGWAKVLLHYACHPVYGKDPDWAKKTREDRKLTEAEWNQEYELSFTENSTNVFDENLIDAATVGQWEPWTYGRVYGAGIDPNEGGEDYYCCRIWDLTGKPYRLVAQYRQNRQLSDLNVAKTIDLLDRYKPGLIAVEAQSDGDMHLMEYTRLRPQFKIVKTSVSNQSKLQSTNLLVLLLERGHLIFPVEDDPEGNPSSNEYRRFIEKKTVTGLRRREAEAGQHDDTVMADAGLFFHQDEFPVPFRATAAASTGDRGKLDTSLTGSPGGARGAVKAL